MSKWKRPRHNMPAKTQNVEARVSDLFRQWECDLLAYVDRNGSVAWLDTVTGKEFADIVVEWREKE